MVPPAQSLQLWKGIWATLTKKKKKKQCFLGGDFLFAFPVPLSLFWGVVLSESAGVCLWGRGRPRGGQGPRSTPRPPLVLSLYVVLVTPIKHASSLVFAFLVWTCCFVCFFFVSFQVSSSSCDTLSLALGVVCPVSPRQRMSRVRTLGVMIKPEHFQECFWEAKSSAE